MVKIHGGPSLVPVAGGTVVPWIILGVYIAFMDVLVAVCTGISHVPERPAGVCFTYVAGKTGCCIVGTFEREFRSLVLFEGIQAVIESLFQGMAFNTIRRNTCLFEFPTVIVVMAIGTG
jgi:hypothetical protein